MAFEAANCLGNAGRFFSPEEFGITADYNADDMWDAHIRGNSMESVYIPFGTSARFYDYDGWGGESFEIVGRNFADNHQRI